jgi:16S rRNA (adenine1518-N6/adenine1519-N6)-dimethyltransferase
VSKHRPRKRFGQHFLIDPGVINAIVDAIAPDENDVIVEIGPGSGAITVPIAKRCGHLHAIELDRDLAARLRTQFAGSERVSIHEADALSFDYSTLGSKLRIIGNLPYNISTPLMFHLLEQRDFISDMHFMLQKEVVDRMASEPGSKAFGRLTIMLGCYLDIDGLFDVDRSSFDPPPAVTSAIVRMRPKPSADIHIKDGHFLSGLVAAAFSKRRKTLRNALKSYATEDDLRALDIDPGLRPENIAISDWVALSNHLGEKADRQ